VLSDKVNIDITASYSKTMNDLERDLTAGVGNGPA